MAVDLAQRYLRQINTETVPKPIELHEKADYISVEEMQLRSVKEKQQREMEEKKREDNLRSEKLRAQQKEMGRGKNDISKKNYTYDFNGNIIVINPIHTDKLHNVVIDSKHGIKHIEKKEDPKGAKNKKEIPVEKITLPGIKSMQKIKSSADDLMRTNYTAPPNLFDVFELADGVTIYENGKQKVNNAKKATMMENGKTRMNKTQFAQLSQKTFNLNRTGALPQPKEVIEKKKDMAKTTNTGSFSNFGKSFNTTSKAPTNKFQTAQDPMMMTTNQGMGMTGQGQTMTAYDSFPKGAGFQATEGDPKAFGKTMKVLSTAHVKDLMSGTDQDFFNSLKGSSSMNNLKGKILAKKKSLLTEETNETQVD